MKTSAAVARAPEISATAKIAAVENNSHFTNIRRTDCSNAEPDDSLMITPNNVGPYVTYRSFKQYK
jgi:hypothetical protein